IRYYVLPMTSAIWSASLSDSLNFPLASFVRFWKNHQLLEIGKGLPWKTITHGSKSYIDRVVPSISGHIRQSTPVCGIDDLGDSIRVTTASDALHYDGVVVATHADTALHLLTHPSPAHRRLLGAWHYSTNRTVLHTDPVVMPPRRSAWCSWNVRDFRAGITTAAAGVTYWMNRLQSLKSATDYFVTLNDCDAIRPDRIIRDMVYTHPIMNRESMATQTELPQLNRQSRVVCCGSYFGYGFHEDAVRSAIHAISELEATLR
ncbi:hypothetical protein EB093_06670, partial [bacterium]|nr:hypothetical protein [bacterium]